MAYRDHQDAGLGQRRSMWAGAGTEAGGGWGTATRRGQQAGIVAQISPQSCVVRGDRWIPTWLQGRRQYGQSRPSLSCPSPRPGPATSGVKSASKIQLATSSGDDDDDAERPSGDGGPPLSTAPRRRSGPAPRWSRRRRLVRTCGEGVMGCPTRTSERWTGCRHRLGSCDACMQCDHVG